MLNVKTSAHFSGTHRFSNSHGTHVRSTYKFLTPKHILSRLLIAFCTFIANIIDATSQLLLLTAFLHLDSNLLSTIVLFHMILNSTICFPYTGISRRFLPVRRRSYSVEERFGSKHKDSCYTSSWTSFRNAHLSFLSSSRPRLAPQTLSPETKELRHSQALFDPWSFHGTTEEEEDAHYDIAGL